MTREEELELAQLESELGDKAPQRTPQSGRDPGYIQDISIGSLTPDEENELNALEKEFSPKETDPNANEEEGILSQIGSLIDQYSGAASTRKAISTLADTGNLREAGNAFINQYSKNPDEAPTGQQVAEKLGFDNNRDGYITNQRTGITNKKTVSDADVAGLGIEIAADPTNLLGYVPFVKIAGKTGSAALKGSAKAVEVADKFTGVPLVKTGEVIGTTAKATAETVKKTKNALVKAFRPGVADDFNDLSRIAAENNIPKELLNEAHMYGENSVVSRYARANAEGPLGGLDKHTELMEKISEASEGKIRKFTNTKYIPDHVEGGAIIRKSYDEAVDNFFKGMGETYSSAIKMAQEAGAPLALDKKSSVILNSKLEQMEKWALGRLGDTKEFEAVANNPLSKKGEVTKALNSQLEVLSSTNKAITKTQRAQAQEVLNAVRLARKAVTEAGGDLGQVYSAMRDIGEIAFKSKNSLAEIPSDVRKFQELYFSLQKGATESIRTGLGDEFADALVKNNSEMSKFFTKRGQLVDIVGNKNMSDEQVFKSLITSGNSQKVDALRSVISKESFDQLRASYIQNVIKTGADGEVNFARTRKNLLKLKQEGKLKLFMSNEEIVELDEILRLGERGGLGVLSTSGTGASNSFKNITETFKNHIANETLVDSIKKSTRDNYVELPKKTKDGKTYFELSKNAPKASSKSGIQKLRDSTPVNKRASAQALKVHSNDERNQRIEEYKKRRGTK